MASQPATFLPESETTQRKRLPEALKAHAFRPGNPGRPKGSRNKLGEDFLKALQADFERDGAAAIVAVRTEKPDAYLKVIASILPKQVDFGDDTQSALKESRDAAVGAFLRAMAEDVANGN